MAAIDAEILSVAREMFLRIGYADTAMKIVALKAGVSKGTLYARYPSKKELWQAVVAEFHTIWRARNLASMELEGLGLSETLHRYGVALVQALRQPDVLAFDRLIAAESGRFPEVAEEFQRQGHSSNINRLSNALVTASKTSGYSLERATDVAAAFTCCLVGWARTVADRNHPSAQECDAYVLTVVKIFVEGRDGWS